MLYSVGSGRFQAAKHVCPENQKYLQYRIFVYGKYFINKLCMNRYIC